MDQSEFDFNDTMQLRFAKSGGRFDTINNLLSGFSGRYERGDESELLKPLPYVPDGKRLWKDPERD